MIDCRWSQRNVRGVLKTNEADQKLHLAHARRGSKRSLIADSPSMQISSPLCMSRRDFAPLCGFAPGDRPLFHRAHSLLASFSILCTMQYGCHWALTFSPRAGSSARASGCVGDCRTPVQPYRCVGCIAATALRFDRAFHALVGVRPIPDSCFKAGDLPAALTEVRSGAGADMGEAARTDPLCLLRGADDDRQDTDSIVVTAIGPNGDCGCVLITQEARPWSAIEWQCSPAEDRARPDQWSAP